MTLCKYTWIALLFAVPALLAQTSASTTAPNTWTTVAAENGSLSITLPAGSTYRLGDYTNNKWSAPVTVTVATTFSPFFFPSGQFPFGDPDYGTVKELDVLQAVAPQTVSVTNRSVSPATTIAQVVPPLVPPTTVPVLPGTSYTLTFSNFSTAPATPANSLMFAFVNAPKDLANRTWEGTQMDMTIDGVTLVCSYGQTYTDGVFSLTCTVPGAPASGSTTSGTTPSGQ